MADASPQSVTKFPTRTLAIIKPHALAHRLDIERRITEAGFEIAKERQMMFHEADKDVEDLFGVIDAISLAEGPVWVYVLERRRAVEVLLTLMGDEDPQVARKSNTNSLRALYGTSSKDNAIIGSSDDATAEHQISMLFAGSPPFQTIELPESPEFAGQTGSLRSITSSLLSALNRENGDRGEVYKARSSQSPVSGKDTSTTGKSTKDKLAGGFRARPVPATTATPSIQPRLSKAAALRAGLIKPNVSIWSEGPRQALSKEEHERTFTNVPGHKRSETIQVASTAAPVVAPRMTRAASLRQGKVDVPSMPVATKPRTRDHEAEKKTFDGVPGHKRRETLQVASVGTPTVAPRLNKSAALRAERDKPPPSSYMYKVRRPSSTKNPTPVSASKRNSQTLERPRSALSLGLNGTNGASASVSDNRPASTTFQQDVSTVPTPASIGKPTIEPRQNKSALLRAKKLESARDGSGKVNGRPVFV